MKVGSPSVEGPWSRVLLHGALTESVRKSVSQGQTRVATSARAQTALGPPLSLPAACRRRAWWQRAVLPPVDSGVTFWCLHPAGLYRRGVCRAAQPGGSCIDWGESEDAVCPPRQMVILLVSQRFSYSLLLKLVP